MRTFLVALAALALIFGLLFGAGRYLLLRTEELSAAVRDFPRLSAKDGAIVGDDDGDAAFVRFSELWERSRGGLHCIVGHEDADRIEDLFRESRVRYVWRDAAGYTAARDALLRALGRLAEGERLSLDGVT